MATQTEMIDQGEIKDKQTKFQDILSDEDLEALFIKHGAQDCRKRKLFVRCFFGSWSFLLVNLRIVGHFYN